uniref:C-type lectin domain-containing protein n=1 Tax=Anas platyrhynchos TaxID=8839 RepID=A0A8B9T3H4_ANAPL
SPPTSPFVSLPLAAGPATRDPEPGFAPRWIRTPIFATLGCTHLGLRTSLCPPGGNPLKILHKILSEPRCHPPRGTVVGLLAWLFVCLSVRLSADGGGCELCPVGWTLHRRKCFWVTSKSSSWRESRENCSHQRAQLLVPEDQGELDFLNRVIQKPTRYFWIGLSQPSVGMAWTWLDGSRLDQSRCHGISLDRIISETCGSALAWICQKEAVLL